MPYLLLSVGGMIHEVDIGYHGNSSTCSVYPETSHRGWKVRTMRMGALEHIAAPTALLAVV